MNLSPEATQKVKELVDYLGGDLWPYGSGRFPDSDRYQLAKAKRLAREIREAMEDQ